MLTEEIAVYGYTSYNLYLYGESYTDDYSYTFIIMFRFVTTIYDVGCFTSQTPFSDTILVLTNIVCMLLDGLSYQHVCYDGIFTDYEYINNFAIMLARQYAIVQNTIITHHEIHFNFFEF